MTATRRMVRWAAWLLAAVVLWSAVASPARADRVAGDVACGSTLAPAAACTGAAGATSPMVAGVPATELVGLAVAAARVCERPGRASALSAVAGCTLAQTSGSEWRDYRRTRLDPWWPVAVAFLVWAALVLVLARVLLVLLGAVLADQLSAAWRRPRPEGRVVGWVALVVSGALAVGPFSLLRVHLGPRLTISLLVLLIGLLVLVGGFLETSARSRSRFAVTAVGCLLVLAAVVDAGAGSGALRGPLTPHPWWGGLAALVSALGFALAWGAGPRLTVTSRGNPERPQASYLRTLVTRLGSAQPAGLEVPVGTDARFLPAVRARETPPTPGAAAVARLAGLVRPPTPWQLVVTAHSADALTVELSRNRRPLPAALVERGALFRFLQGSADEHDLTSFPAAFAVLYVARAHGTTRGLAGATGWRSVALQYLGATQPRRSTTRALFAAAVADDPQNLAARLSSWHARYREASTADDLRRYRELLEGALTDQRLQDEPVLLLRLLYTRVLVGINLRSLDLGADENLEVRAGDLLALSAQAPAAGAEALWTDLRRHAVVLVRSIPAVQVPDVEPPRPEEAEPGLNYLWGCYFTTNGADSVRAVRHLRQADQDPELARRRRSDPQLAALRRSEAYRAEFGERVPTDILAVPPFRQHAQALRSAGLVNLERLGLAEVSDLVALGLPTPAAEWVTQVARFGLTVPADLEEWVVPIVATFAEQGLVAIPADDRSLASLRTAILDACEPLVSSPNLDLWL